MFTHAIDISCTNAWLEYKNDATELGMSKKEILDLIHFRAYIAEALILSNKFSKKRGRPTKSPSESPASSRAGSPSSLKRLRDDMDQ